MPENSRPGIVSLKLRIDWSEMDLFGHINNVMFMKYVQAARVNFWEHIGIGGAADSLGIGANLASTKCDFILPLFYPGNVLIETGVSFIKNSSFGLHHVLKNDADAIAANAEDAVVLYNYSKGEKVLLSDDLRKKLQEYLK